MNDVTDQSILRLHPSRWAFFSSYFVGVLCFGFHYIGALLQLDLPWLKFLGPLVGAIVMLVTEIVRKAETFVVEKNGLSREFVLLSHTHAHVGYEDIQEVHMRRGLLQRIVRVGDIQVKTASESEVGLVFHSIPDPEAALFLIHKKMGEFNGMRHHLAPVTTQKMVS